MRTYRLSNNGSNPKIYTREELLADDPRWDGLLNTLDEQYAKGLPVLLGPAHEPLGYRTIVIEDE